MKKKETKKIKQQLSLRPLHFIFNGVSLINKQTVVLIDDEPTADISPVASVLVSSAIKHEITNGNANNDDNDVIVDDAQPAVEEQQQQNSNADDDERKKSQIESN